MHRYWPGLPNAGPDRNETAQPGRCGDAAEFGVADSALRQPAPEARRFGTPTRRRMAGLLTRTVAGIPAASPDLQYFFGPVQYVERQYQVRRTEIEVSRAPSWSAVK
jgi:hypothetical protein